MAKTAMVELQQQIEEVRREAFAVGYAAAMQAVRELASQPAPVTGLLTARRRGRGGAERKAGSAEPTRQRRAGARSRGTGGRRRPGAHESQRGSNAQMIEEILRAAAPRALRQAEIRKGLQEKGVEVAFTSIRHALSQLEARNAAEQLGDSKSWRHRGGGS